MENIGNTEYQRGNVSREMKNERKNQKDRVEMRPRVTNEHHLHGLTGSRNAAEERANELGCRSTGASRAELKRMKQNLTEHPRMHLFQQL